jgi:hypothetical protein
MEIQARRSDVGLIRTVAATLRGAPDKAKVLRSTLERALANPNIKSAFDVFGSDLPDEVFDGVFDQRLEGGWRPVDL